MESGNVGPTASCSRTIESVELDDDLIAEIRRAASVRPGGVRKELTARQTVIIRTAFNAGVSAAKLDDLLRVRGEGLSRSRIKREYERLFKEAGGN